jgi:hypothetical protein
VESVENDVFSKVVHETLPAAFKSEAVPRLTSTNKKVNGEKLITLTKCNLLSVEAIRCP